MSDVQFTEMAATDIDEQNRLSAALGRVQRVSLVLWVFTFFALVAAMVDRRWFPLTMMMALAGGTGMIVQATGRMRLVGAAVNSFVALMYTGAIITFLMNERTADLLVLGLVTLVPVVVLSALNAFFIAKVPRQTVESSETDISRRGQ